MTSAGNPKAAAWGPAELRSVHDRADKAGRVRAMFAAIAPSYDLNNRLHSFGQDQAWRRRAVREAQLGDGEVVVDVACGTGDLAEAFARAGAGRVIGVDFTQEMLDIAEHKRDRMPPGARARIEYVRGDAMALDLPDASADVVSIAFGIRNVTDPARALAEFHRVLRPGGRLVILEFDRPRAAPLRALNDFYCSTIMPRTATLLSRDRSGAYRYLPRSVQTFLDRDQLAAMVAGAGFQTPRSIPLTFGVCICTVARRA
ncbi:MAG: bifunctional demethylmenaquinone methyltransferase/2-methoxy-6-polyprenyl-1,4-benzoquinol methylase UbiE [Phycisphaerales bacterium JB039]